MKLNLLQMHGETGKIPPRPKFDPRGEIEIHHIHQLWADGERAARFERARKRHMLVTVGVGLALGWGAALLLALWLKG